MMSNKTVIILFVSILSISWIQAMPNEPKTVEDNKDPYLFSNIRNYLTQQSTPSPMTAKDKTVENDFLLKSTTSAQEDSSSIAVTAPVTNDDQLRIAKLFSWFFLLKMTQEEQIVAVLSPVIILFIASMLIVVLFIVVWFYRLRKFSQKRYDIEEPSIKMSELFK
ncbi:conserved hypothetical protein [Cotesia vestalis bracovirus]|nr:conserved hypothetical protein [Cotesia vestalis bracovirus]